MVARLLGRGRRVLQVQRCDAVPLGQLDPDLAGGELFVDYEPLFDRVSALTVAGERAHDLALRCIYGGADADALVVEPDPGKALDTALAAAGPGDTVFALPTYTAMLDLRAELVRRDLVVPFWEDA